MLTVKNIATIDIPKYSDLNDLYRYAREITIYVDLHDLKSRIYTDKETTHIFLSHLDNPHYASSVREIEGIVQLSPVTTADYLVPEITGTLDQLAPWTSHQNRPNYPTQNDQIGTIME